MNEHVYRSRMQVVGGAATGIIGGLLGVLMLIESDRPAEIIIASIFLAFFVPTSIRFARARIVTSDDAVFVANVFANRLLNWSDIERFEMGRWTIFPYVCLIRLRNGEVVHAFGIQERTNFPDESGEKMAEEMNAELRERRMLTQQFWA